MEPDNLKSAWKNMATTNRSAEALQGMIRENKHPVLKGIRRQMIIEILSWIIFLVVYYDFFDGHRKPFYVNLLLVAAVGFVLIHSVWGYLFTRNLAKGNNLIQSLENYLAGMKRYAIVSVASRVVTILALLLFFTAVIKVDTFKYLVLGGLLLVVVFQAILLSRIWLKRIKHLQESIGGFSK